MKFNRLLVLPVILVFAGCQTSRFKHMTGTQLESTSKGQEAVTYVTQKEYDAMTPTERQSMNAAVGASVTFGGSGNTQAKPKDVSEEDLDKAAKDAKK